MEEDNKDARKEITQKKEEKKNCLPTCIGGERV
jgi:hypothetical protein